MKVFLHPNSASLWKKYLLFTQSYFSNFTVSKVNSAYGKCLSTLSAVRDGTMLSHPALPGIEEDMLGNTLFDILKINYRLASLLMHPSCYTTDTVFFFTWNNSNSCFFRYKHLCCMQMLIEVFFPLVCPDIFNQQCHFLRQAGHSEKAISLFQAMIDFTFYKPDSVQKMSTKQQVTHTKAPKPHFIF